MKDNIKIRKITALRYGYIEIANIKVKIIIYVNINLNN